jgi:hypothetical protein
VSTLDYCANGRDDHYRKLAPFASTLGHSSGEWCDRIVVVVLSGRDAELGSGNGSTGSKCVNQPVKKPVISAVLSLNLPI